MAEEPIVQSLEDLLAASSASASFKEAVRVIEAGGRQDQIRYNRSSPPVKVLRAVMKLIEEHPRLALESVELEGESACSNFTGRAVAQPGGLTIDFNWDCAWRAGQMGWTDAFGDPDQIRAAQTFGYQCFERFSVRERAPN